MQLRFQASPWDLYAAIAYAVAVGLAALAVGAVPAAFFLLVFVPGYVIVAALFPAMDDLGGLERIVLSLGVSIVVTPLLGFGLSFTPLGITTTSALIVLIVFVWIVGAIAYWRRMRLVPEERLAVAITFALTDVRGYSKFEKTLAAFLVISILLAATVVGYSLLVPRPGERFTDFYILGPGGTAAGYPTRLNVSERGLLIVGLVNREGVRVNYTVRIDLVGLLVAFNSTANANESTQVNRTTMAWLNQSVVEGANWSMPFTFSIPYSGYWEVQFFLYENDVMTALQLHLYVRVT